MSRAVFSLLALALVTPPLVAQPDPPVLLKPDRVFDGDTGTPDVKALRKVRLVMKGGTLYKQP